MLKLGVMMRNFFRQIRAHSEGRIMILPSLLVALFLLFGCGNLGLDDSIIIENDATELENAKQLTEGSDEAEIPKEAKISEYVVVYVCGAVTKPGVYELLDGSRIVDAVAMAGGFSDNADYNAINLACEVQDASKIYIPTVDETVKEGIVTADGNICGAGDEDNGLININTANEQRLTDISGIGETKAKSIVAYREEHGTFKTTEEIMQVSGIGEGTYQKIKDQITVH